MDAGDIIIIIIWIMDEDNVRHPGFKAVGPVIRYRHIIRVLIPLVMHFLKAPIRVPVIVRNGDHIGVAIFICVRRLPDAFQGVPHGNLIGKEHHLKLIGNLLPYPFAQPLNMPV